MHVAILGRGTIGATRARRPVRTGQVVARAQPSGAGALVPRVVEV